MKTIGQIYTDFGEGELAAIMREVVNDPERMKRLHEAKANTSSLQEWQEATKDIWEEVRLKLYKRFEEAHVR